MTENLKAARKIAQDQAGAKWWTTMDHMARLWAISDALDAIRLGR